MWLTRLTRLPFLRGMLLAALAGHWVANALFDREEYDGASAQELARLDDPILVQAGLLLLVVLGLTWVQQRRPHATSRPSLTPGTLVALFTGIQLTLFLVMELTERLAVGAVGEASEAVMMTGLLPELGVALLVAVVFTIAVLATTRAVRASRVLPQIKVANARHLRVASYRARRTIALRGGGGVRAPPLTA